MDIFKKIKKGISGDKVDVPEFEVMDVRDFVAPPSLKIGSDYLQVGERYARTFFVFSYPQYLTTGWFSPIVNLDTPMDIAFHVNPVDTSEVLKNLRKRITATQAEMMERQKKGLIRDPKLQHSYQNMEDLRDRLQTGQEKMYSLGLYLTIYGEDEKKLREIETTLRSILEGRLIYIKPAVYQQGDGFVTTSPYLLDRILVHTPMNTAPLSSVFPFISFDLSSNKGILYGINQHNNSLILFDRFDMESYNEVVFGTSGSGKSIVGEETVLVRNKEGLFRTKIGKLVDELIDEKGATRIDEEMEGVIGPDLEVFTFNEELKGEWSEVSVAARKDAPETLYKFKTKSGREITTTGDHNFVALKNGKVKVTKSTNLKKGDFIPLPRKVKNEKSEKIEEINLLNLLKDSKRIYVEGGRKTIEENWEEIRKININEKLDPSLYKYRQGRRMPLPYYLKILNALKIKPDLENIKLTSQNGTFSFPPILKTTKDFFEILGLISANGSISEKIVVITSTRPETVSRIKKHLKKTGIPFFCGVKDVRIGARVPVEIFKKLCGKEKAEKKKVPSLIFDASKEKVASYLAGYFEGDGTTSQNGGVTAVSKSKDLISDISYLLYQFGIVARIKKRRKRATNNTHQKETYNQIKISGKEFVEKFKKEIGFLSSEKRNVLKNRLKEKGNTNIDVTPEISSVLNKINKHFGFNLGGIDNFHAVRRRDFNPSRKTLKRIVKEIEKRVEGYKALKPNLEVLSSLPSLVEVIDIAGAKPEVNRKLWEELGSSWAFLRKKQRPFSKNAFKAIEISQGKMFSLQEIKRALYVGFQNTDLTVSSTNQSLQKALVEEPQGNTSYKTLRRSSQKVWKKYQKILKEDLPVVEENILTLKKLTDSDLFWDPVVEIEKLKNKKHKYVYDLQVANEVFLAGNGGLFVHNSFMIKLELLRSLMTGIDVMVLDPENEYEFLSDAVDGSFLNMSLTSPNHINPFDLPKPREGEDPENVLRSNIINLVGLMRIMMGGLNPEEDAIIDRALTETYQARDITPDSDPSTWEENTPIMSDLESVLETMEGAESLVRRIRKFTEGTYSSFFNQPTNISMDKNFVSFGIRDMEEELKQLAMFVIMRYIWKEITSELKKRILVIDEAWWMMQSEDGASFLYGLVKRARKYWLGVTTITQDVGDFMRSEYGQPIVANSAIQILMKQSPSTIEIVKDTFNLTEEEKMRLLEASIGEGLFFAGAKHVAINVVASYTEDQIITTSPGEVQKIKKAKKALGGNEPGRNTRRI